MDERLSHEQWTAARAALLGNRSSDLLDLVFDLHVGHALDADEATWGLAHDLGWVDRSTRTFTKLGELVADPVREYRFWIDRGRIAHRETEHAPLAAERYRGLSVLEPGSGFGCNLFSLSRVPGRFVGLEPVDIYRQFTPIFAEREGIACPEIVGGTCEALPFRDGEFDVVLCYSAHQYMDVDVALCEMARVLRPGGQIRIVGHIMSTFLVDAWERLVARRSVKRLVGDALTVANTISYTLAGRRLVVPGSGRWTTTAPIYPSHRYLRRRLGRLGLEFRADLSADVTMGVCLIAERVH